jgi:cytochrome c5
MRSVAMKHVLVFSLAAATVLCAKPRAFANPVTYELPPETAQLRPGQGPGREAAQNNCMTCHSVDYIAIQPPKKGKAFWESEVNKMVQTYKAEISADDAKVIADYLASAY